MDQQSKKVKLKVTKAESNILSEFYQKEIL